MIQGRVALIKKFFEAEPFGRKVTAEEVRALNNQDREELAQLIKVELESE